MFYGRVLSRAEPFDYGVDHVVFAWFALCICFANSVCFGRSKNLIFSSGEGARTPEQRLVIETKFFTKRTDLKTVNNLVVFFLSIK